MVYIRSGRHMLVAIEGLHPNPLMRRYAVQELSKIQIVEAPFYADPAFDPAQIDDAEEVLCVVQQQPSGYGSPLTSSDGS